MTKRVAVLGAGLTGLSSAFHLSRLHPNIKITLIEKQRNTGGWVRSTRVQLQGDHGSALLEAGPRTLRPNANSVLELVNLLGLKHELITISKDSPAAQARFLYTPSTGLQKIPSSLTSLLTSPLSRTLVPAVVQELFKFGNRPKGAQDESVDAFLRRRFGASFADTFGSAIIHGIYAADSRKISVRAAFASMWDAEARGWGGLVRGMLIPSKKAPISDYDVGDIPRSMENVSVYSFRNGIQTLTDALEAQVRKQPNIELLLDTPATALQRTSDGFAVRLAEQSIEASHVISALPTLALHSLLAPAPQAETAELTANSTSSVHVVNIVFPGPPCNIHPDGFGYLIPRPATDYPLAASDADLGILGTVFDACSLSAQDSTTSSAHAYHTAKFTKLTVMIGGPYPLQPLPPHLSSSEAPSQYFDKDTLPTYMQRVMAQLSVHLDRSLPLPVYWRIIPNINCIPTLSPGHLERMEALQSRLDTQFEGRLQVVGAGVGGVSLGDCVESGRKVACCLSI